jgi:beta-galactosidase
VALVADRTTIEGNGEDVSVVTVSIVDDRGRIVPTADGPVAFKVEGPGRIIGLGNGDPSSHEPDKFFAPPVVRTRSLAEWRWRKIADPYAPNLPEAAASFDDSAWSKIQVTTESGPLGPGERAVFRRKVGVSAQDLAAPALELWFGKIDGGVSVFVNDRKIGPAGDARAPSIYDVKPFLHPGENTVAVSIANWGETAGLNKGAELRLIDEAPASQWRRSVFSGLAQVIVQSTWQSGTIKLAAEAKALRPATLTIGSRPVERRPALP